MKQASDTFAASIAELGSSDASAVCEICGAKKERRTVQTFGGEEIEVYALVCDCYEPEKVAERESKVRRRRVISYDIARAERVSGFGEDARSKTLSNFKVSNERMADVLEIMETFPPHVWLDTPVPGIIKDKRFLAIFDYPPREGRRGKTHLLCGIYNRWREEGASPVYLNWSHYLTLRQHLMSDQDAATQSSAWLNAVINPLYPLVIDDFLKQNVRTPWAAEIAYNLIDSRLRSGAAVVLAANVKLDDREAVITKLSKLGEADEFAGRVHQRLRENGVGVDVTGWRQFGREQTMVTLR